MTCSQMLLRNITRGALELLISDSLASSKCYGKCRRITFFGRWFCTMDKENRYCPDANTGCEAKCLTTRKGGNKEVDLIGKKFLAGYGLTVAQILEKSYQNYQRHGNMFRGPVDIKKTGMGLDAIATGETSMIALPICISEFVEVTGAPGADKSRYPHFPCSCGDWTGNETQSFYSRLGLARGDRDVTTGEASELFERICKILFSNISSVHLHYKRNSLFLLGTK
jgi:hypothetical protein